MKKIIPYVISLSVFAIPLVSLAVRFDTVVNRFVDVLKTAGGALLAIAVFLIIVGIFRYLSAGDDAKRRAEAVQLLTWGLVTVFVMIMLWGFVNILTNTFFTPEEVENFELNQGLWNVS